MSTMSGGAGYGSTGPSSRVGQQPVQISNANSGQLSHSNSLNSNGPQYIRGPGWELNEDLSSYLVTKHSWKGKYKRIFSIGTKGITTYNPTTLEVTNQWLYGEVINVLPVVPRGQMSPAGLPTGGSSVAGGPAPPTLTIGGREEFTLTFMQGKKKKTDSMKFSSEFRTDILSEVLSFRRHFAEGMAALSGTYDPLRVACHKHHWSERKLPVTIEVGCSGISQLHSTNGKILTTYHYKDIDGLALVSDVQGGFIISTSGFGRLHLFSVVGVPDVESKRDDLLKRICESSWTHTGTVLRVRKDPMTLDYFHSNRFGKYSSDECVTSMCEFVVQKISPRTSGSGGGFAGSGISSPPMSPTNTASLTGVEPIKRIMALSDSCLLERDPNSYSIVSLRPLSEISALIRNPTNPQLFAVEGVKGSARWYISTDRDALLASLMDGVRASGNVDIHVKMRPTRRGDRIGPHYVPVEEEVEVQSLRWLATPPHHLSFSDIVHKFNCNCAYRGLLHSTTSDGMFAANKEKLIINALMAFVDREDYPTSPGGGASSTGEITNEDLEAHFQAIRRLVASRAGFAHFSFSERFRNFLGIKVVKSLKRNNDAVTHAAIDMICALMQPMHSDYDLRNEQLNKQSLLASKSFIESLLDVLKSHVDRGTGALVVASMLDFLTFALCAPYSETTDGNHFDTLLGMVADYGRPIFSLFHHPSLAIIKGAGLVMKAIIEEGDEDISRRMQELALAEGALIKHLHIALYSPASDGRFLAVQHLSRHLVGLWIAENPTAQQVMRRIFPIGLLNYLESAEQPPKSALARLYVRDNLKIALDASAGGSETLAKVKGTIQTGVNAVRDLHPQVRIIEKQLDTMLTHWRSRIGIPKRDVDPRIAAQQRPVVLRRRRERVKSTANWNMFFYQFLLDHAKPDLIWNFKTREELRDSLETEIRAFNTDKELCSSQTIISWNYSEFEVYYLSLSEEIKIGDYYLRLLLDDKRGGHSTSTDELAKHLSVKEPFVFFNDLYHRFLLATKTPMRCACLQAMATVYAAYSAEIGPFNDTKYLITMLERSTDKMERDRLIILLSKLVANATNIKLLIEAGGIRILIDLVTLAHLHVSRVMVPAQTNVIEASPDQMEQGQRDLKEWYYGDAEKERHGPVSWPEIRDLWKDGTITPDTKCWAQGLEGWRPLKSIPQLKWCLMAEGSTGILNESQLAIEILSVLIGICELYPSRDADGAIVRPLPRVKRILSELTCLPHIVQLLLTFEPVLVERVATLVHLIMQDNPSMPRLYTSGIFFFIMMYTGSNLLPIGRLLSATHTQQAFKFEENSNSGLQRSILGQLLPEAMICYLDNYGPEKFAQIFLGEFDTPEAIWSGEMRRMLIEKIAGHIADFSPRLQSNTRALYQYCPIPAIQYPQLECELFCNMYYLKNLCDTVRFKGWPIKEPVNLLRDILTAWKEEVNKKAPSMSIEDALAVLELDLDSFPSDAPPDEHAIRRAYFKMAAKYHPDKNPEGRDKFEAANRAYEFLCSRNVRNRLGGPDPQNIQLILRSQSILFDQCSQDLQPYKYAGYPMLVKTLRMETEDEQLFSKSHPLLGYACETAYWTVRCSALNAEELRREGGLEILQEAFTRCVGVIGKGAKPDDVPVQVVTHIMRCFTVAAEFPACRTRLTEMLSVSRDLCRLLNYNNLNRMCLVAVECIASFAADPILVMNLHQAGVLFSLLLFLFRYDYTLAEGGVESEESTNEQHVMNELAIVSIIALGRLAGGDEATYNQKANRSSNDSQAAALISRSLNALLTCYLTRRISTTGGQKEVAAEILKILNSNIETPYIIWNNGTRAELTEYLTLQQRETLRSGEPPDGSYGAEFVYSSYENELIVGEVFVRVYTQQPLYPLEDAKGFTRSLLDYIGSQAQYLHSLLALNRTQSPVNGGTVPLTAQSGDRDGVSSPTSTGSSGSSSLSPERISQVEVCLKALGSVLRHSPGVERECIGHFRLLFSLLRLEQVRTSIQDLAVDVIKCVSGSVDCVQDIAQSDVLTYLLLVLHYVPGENLASRHQNVLESLIHLMSNTTLVKEAVTKGAILYALNLFCNSRGGQVRQSSAELMAKMCADKLTGPRIRLLLVRFLPSLFIDAMKDSPEVAVSMFETNQENPELIWNDDSRARLCSTLKKMADDLHEMQLLNINMPWKIPDDFDLNAELISNVSNEGEVIVGGVYLRLFVQNPTWVLRRPKEFLTELMNTSQALMARDSEAQDEKMDLVVNSITGLLKAQPVMLDLIPAMGYIPGLISNLSLSTLRETLPKSCITILGELANNKACVEIMATTGGVMEGIRTSLVGFPATVPVACEALNRMLANENERLVGQALESNLVATLLRLLDSSRHPPIPSGVPPSSSGTELQGLTSSCRALIVQVLQAMCESPTHGLRVRELLDKSSVWAEYRDQKHDLFLSNTPISGYLTGTANVAGYLTQGSSAGAANAIATSPPPMEY